MGRAEAKVENHFVECCKAAGGVVRKVTYQGRKGSPDRWAFFPRQRLLIVELKRFKEEPEEIQYVEMELLRGLGFWVAWTDTKEGAQEVVGDFLSITQLEFNRKWPIRKSLSRAG